jgi:hypothetical protein
VPSWRVFLTPLYDVERHQRGCFNYSEERVRKERQW